MIRRKLFRRALAKWGFPGFFLAVAIVVLISALCWDYSISFWANYFVPEKGDFPFLMALAVSFMPGIGQLGISVAILTWVISFFF